MYFIQKTLKQQYKREGNTTQMHSIRYILLQIMGIDPAWGSSAFGIVVTQRYYKYRNSDSLVFVSNTAAVALYPKNQPFAVPGLTTNVFPIFLFCILCV
jgi:hypothetical protein